MSSTIISEESAESVEVTNQQSVWSRLIRNPSVVIGGFLIFIIVALVPAAPFLTPIDPTDISPRNRNKAPGYETVHKDDEGNKYTLVAHMGTDKLGRDVYSRVLYGARVGEIIILSVHNIMHFVAASLASNTRLAVMMALRWRYHLVSREVLTEFPSNRQWHVLPDGMFMK